MPFFDPDARPPEQARTYLDVGGRFFSPDGTYELAPDPRSVRTAAWWDELGDGSRYTLLLATGCDSTTSQAHIQKWNGETWEPMGSRFINCVRGVVTCDFDGDGPQQSTLFAIGSFSAVGEQTASGIAQWNGTDWVPLPAQLPFPNGSYVRNAYQWDPDGDGPMTPRLLVVGNFSNPVTGAPSAGIASWNGSAWESFSSNLSGIVTSAVMWDPDGEGPLPRSMYICGTFNPMPGPHVRQVARLDGHTITVFPGTGLSFGGGAHFYAIECWDPDGDGPMTEQLFVAGSEITPNQADVCRWNGESWEPLGASNIGYVFDLHAHDPDGPGPMQRTLFAGGQLQPSMLRMWNGTAWTTPLFEQATVCGFLPAAPPNRPQHGDLLVAGESTAPSGTSVVPRHRPLLTTLTWRPPSIENQPMDTSLCASGMAIFTGGPDYEGPERRWQIALPTAPEDWLDLHEGAYMVGDAVVLHTFGVRTGELFVTMPANGARALLGGNPRVRCVLSNSCGESITDAAELRLCPADLDCSDSIDDLDITEFFTLFEVGAAAADFTGDGSIDDLDIAVFFEAFESGC